MQGYKQGEENGKKGREEKRIINKKPVTERDE